MRHAVTWNPRNLSSAPGNQFTICKKNPTVVYQENSTCSVFQSPFLLRGKEGDRRQIPEDLVQ